MRLRNRLAVIGKVKFYEIKFIVIQVKEFLGRSILGIKGTDPIFI